MSICKSCLHQKGNIDIFCSCKIVTVVAFSSKIYMIRFHFAEKQLIKKNNFLRFEQ